jgi:MerR family transcriptional regulator, copper efflux regulator
MARTLSNLAEHCCGDARPDCPILDDLATTAPGTRETKSGA